MNRGRWALLAGLAVGTLAASGCWDNTPVSPTSADAAHSAQPERARLRAAQGEVTLTRDGTSGPAQPGPLRLKDVVETGSGASAEIAFPDGRSVQVGENARFVLEEEDGGLVLSLAQGAVLSRIPADAADGGPGLLLTVRTPYGLTRLGSQAQDVEVKVSGSTASVDVKLGEVALLGKDGKTTSAKAGERLELSAGKVELLSRTPTPAVLETLKVVVRAAPGAEVKPKGAARWRRVASKGEALEEGTALRTGKGPARLVLAGARSTLEVGSGSEVVIGQFGKRGQREESHLELRRGRLVGVSQPGAETALELPDVKLSEAVTGGRYEVRKNGAVLELRALAGDLGVSHDGTEQSLPAGQRADFTPGAPPALTPLEPAALKLNTRSGTRVFHSGLSDVTLTWPGEGGDWQVEVSETPDFTQLVAAGTVHEPSVTVPAPRRGPLYWRAKGKRSEEKGFALFAPEGTRNDLQRLRNEVPDGAEKTTIFFQDKPPAVTFTFSTAENAAKYRLAVFRVTELQSPVAERETSDTRVRLEEGALAEGNYVWSITPVSAQGTALPTRGRMNKLEIVYDNAVPLLVILSPANGTLARGKLPARGIAPLGSRVYINGKPAPLDEKGRFDTLASPQGSPPVIIFKMARPGEADAVTVRTLKSAG
jgi:hypothetical protein